MKSISQIAQENEDKKLNKYLREEFEEEQEDSWRERADYEYERMMDERSEMYGK